MMLDGSMHAYKGYVIIQVAHMFEIHTHGEHIATAFTLKACQRYINQQLNERDNETTI
jgi:alpha-D-ribose 1-methylphosphonate 5-phosphate C-P lyase